MAEKDLWYPPNTHVFMFQLDSKHDYENDNSGLLVVEDITIVIRSFLRIVLLSDIENPELIVFEKKPVLHWEPYHLFARDDWKVSWTRETVGSICDLVSAYDEERNGMAVAGHLKTGGGGEPVRFLLFFPPEHPESKFPSMSVVCLIYGRDKHDAEFYAEDLLRLMKIKLHP